jgi:hypothetical protein
VQARNYIAMKENERKRKEMFNDALEDFRAGKLEDALYQCARALSASLYIAARAYLVLMVASCTTCAGKVCLRLCADAIRLMHSSPADLAHSAQFARCLYGVHMARSCADSRR